MSDNPTKERFYTNDSAYILPADEEERKRLRRQHEHLTRAFDNRVILAPVQLAGGDQVLEIGAAAGAWLFDAAQEIESSSKINFHAIDIENRHFPSTPPPNMSFSIASVLELPEIWAGKFSYVHQRLLMGALTEAQWPIAIKEIYRVLKPGGWVEMGEGEARIGCPDGHGRPLGLELVHQFYLSRGLMVDIGSELPNLLKAAGFVDIKITPKKIPMGKSGGELGEGGVENMCGFLRAVKKPVLAKGGFGLVQTGEEYDALVDDLEKVFNEVPGYSWAHYITYAKKPEGVDN